MEPNKFNFNIVTKKDKKYIYDLIRKKYILLTEEEKVRQIIINYLISELEIPISHISSEKGFLIDTGLKKRFDVIVHDRHGKIAILIECKSSKIKINSKVIDQILIYNQKLNSKYLMVTNGTHTIALDCNNMDIRQIKSLPIYSEL